MRVAYSLPRRLLSLQVREVVDRNKPNCFELYATGGNEFIKGNEALPFVFYRAPFHGASDASFPFTIDWLTRFFSRCLCSACKTDSEGKVVEGKHTVYRMSAAEQSEKDEWIACIR